MENRPPPATVQLRPLPLKEKRVVGGPVPERVLAAYFGVALLAWIGAGIAVVRAAPDLARAAPFSGRVILAAHLVALGVLPFAVAGASFHLLPVMLRRDLPSPRALWLALLLLVGGPAVAFGLSNASRTTTWAGAALVACGLAVVVVELGWIVLRAPHDRTLIASRLGVTLSLAHAALALCLGAFVFDRPVHDFGRRVVAHLHLALVGWIALLVLTVGRNLAPMLAQAPAAPRRRLPVDEVVLVAGLWILVAGILDGSRLVTLVGGAVVVATIARFGTLLVRTYRAKHAAIDAPLGHLLAGAAFLVQAVVVGVVAALEVGGTRTVVAYVVLLLGGWAAGVVTGHVPKLLSLSVWVWWPPGPRPKQAALYPRRLMLAEALVFAAGIELLAAGVLARSVAVTRTGSVLVLAATLLVAAAALDVWRRRLLQRRP